MRRFRTVAQPTRSETPIALVTVEAAVQVRRRGTDVQLVAAIDLVAEEPARLRSRDMRRSVCPLAVRLVGIAAARAASAFAVGDLRAPASPMQFDQRPRS